MPLFYLLSQLYTIYNSHTETNEGKNRKKEKKQRTKKKELKEKMRERERERKARSSLFHPNQSQSINRHS